MASMLASSFAEFDGGHGFFLGLPRPEELLRPEPLSKLGVLLDGTGTMYQNCPEVVEGRVADGPTSSGSGHTHAHKPQNDYQNAQKRFRARQKERMSCLEREVAEKKAAFEQLAHENLLLRARTRILEKVVGCRDEQLSLVQAFEERCRTAGPHVQSCFGSGGSNTVAEGSAAMQDSFRKMRKEQVVPQYKAFLAEVSRHLLHCQHPCCDPTNPIVQQVTASVERMGHLLKHLVLLNSPLMKQLLLLNLENMQPAAPAESHWDAVVASLQLGAEQRADILAVLDLYYGLLDKVYEERKLICSGLRGGGGTLEPWGPASHSPSASPPAPSPPTCSSTPSPAPAPALLAVGRQEFAAEMELTERLHSNLAKEHSAHTLLSCFFFGKVLAPPQFAKVAVYSYPFFPDCLAVASAVARSAGRVRGSGSGSGSGGVLPVGAAVHRGPRGPRPGAPGGGGPFASGSQDSQHRY